MPLYKCNQVQMHHSPYYRPISQETRCWSKESNFIQKARELSRWWTNVLKNNVNLGSNSSFFYASEGASRKGLRSGTSKGPRRIVKALCSWTLDLGWCESNRNVTINLDKTITIFVHTSLSPLGRQVLDKGLFAQILICRQNSFSDYINA